MQIYKLLEKVRSQKPVVHHLTNWVTIYDCAQVVKSFGASPVMAHAKEEVEDMVKIASSLVLNIGTLTVDFVEAMKLAARSANAKGIPIVLDVCGAGATRLRDKKCFEIIDHAAIDIIKGNSSEIARIAGEDVRTKGVDAGEVKEDLIIVAKKLARKYNCAVVITGKEDIVAGIDKVCIVKNGHQMMTHVVGTGCMAASVIGTFAAVERDYVYAASAGLSCFGIAGELAAKKSKGPMAFKQNLLDSIYALDENTVKKMQRVTLHF